MLMWSSSADVIPSLQKIERADPRPATQELIADLLLSIPMRLAMLSPYLRHLVRPVITALKSSNAELLMSGLRSLEVWAEMLTPEMLDTVFDDLYPVCFGIYALFISDVLAGGDCGCLRADLTPELKCGQTRT